MPNASAHIPDDSELWAQIKTAAERDYAGKVSAFVRSAIEDKLAGAAASDGMSPSIVVDLTRQLLGEPAANLMAEVFTRSPRTDAQARWLRKILERELAAFERAESYVEESQAPYMSLFVEVPKAPAPAAKKKKA